MHKAALYQRSNGLQRRDAKEVLDVIFFSNFYFTSASFEILVWFLRGLVFITRGDIFKTFFISLRYYNIDLKNSVW